MRRREFVRSLAGLPFLGAALPARAAADAVPALAAAGFRVMSLPCDAMFADGTIYLGQAVPGTPCWRSGRPGFLGRIPWVVRFRAAVATGDFTERWPFSAEWKAGDLVYVFGASNPGIRLHGVTEFGHCDHDDFASARTFEARSALHLSEWSIPRLPRPLHEMSDAGLERWEATLEAIRRERIS